MLWRVPHHGHDGGLVLGKQGDQVLVEKRGVGYLVTGQPCAQLFLISAFDMLGSADRASAEHFVYSLAAMGRYLKSGFGGLIANGCRNGLSRNGNGYSIAAMCDLLIGHCHVLIFRCLRGLIGC